MIEKEYYRFDELEKRFELSLSDLRYLVESSQIEPVFYLDLSKCIFGGWLKEKSFVGFGIANYRGLVKISKQEQHELLSNDKTTIRYIRALDKDGFMNLAEEYPFESDLPNSFLHAWQPRSLSSIAWDEIPAKLFPQELEHSLRTLGKAFNQMIKSATGKELEATEQSVKALEAIPEKSFCVAGVELSHTDICLLHSDLVKIGVVKSSAAGETFKLSQPVKGEGSTSKRIDDLSELLVRIVEKHPEYTAKQYWRALERESEEVEGFRLIDKYNILTEVEGNQIRWQDRAGKPRKTVSFSSFTNRLTEARKKSQTEI
jgi:hypothetical protein